MQLHLLLSYGSFTKHPARDWGYIADTYIGKSTLEHPWHTLLKSSVYPYVGFIQQKINSLLCLLLVWKRTLYLSKLSRNRVTRYMWLMPTFPRSMCFTVELNSTILQEGSGATSPFRAEHLLWSALASPLQSLHITNPHCHLRIWPPGWMVFIQSNLQFPPSKVNLIMVFPSASGLGKS